MGVFDMDDFALGPMGDFEDVEAPSHPHKRSHHAKKTSASTYSHKQGATLQNPEADKLWEILKEFDDDDYPNLFK